MRKNFLNLNKQAIIYVLCPAYIKTGGPELLHQLVCELNKNNYKAFITYYGCEESNTEYTCSDFKKYVSDYKMIDEIDDNNNNIIICPESISAINVMSTYNSIKKAIWWLSVDNFTKNYGIINPIKTFGLISFVKLLIKQKLILNFNKIRNVSYHLCQSYYAIDFLKKMNIEEGRIAYLSDYISDEYLKITKRNWPKKEDIVLYNPKKGFKYTQRIIETAKGIKFIPIQNLTTNEVKDLLLKSKVYIDFGNHPGKDRFPRESAICGCCVITGKKGSAKYYDDVPISDEFKFDDKIQNIPNIINKIKDCIDGYDEEIKKFEEYRCFIYSEKDTFKTDVKKIFID